MSLSIVKCAMRLKIITAYCSANTMESSLQYNFDNRKHYIVFYALESHLPVLHSAESPVPKLETDEDFVTINKRRKNWNLSDVGFKNALAKNVRQFFSAIITSFFEHLTHLPVFFVKFDTF